MRGKKRKAAETGGPAGSRAPGSGAGRVLLITGIVAAFVLVLAVSATGGATQQPQQAAAPGVPAQRADRVEVLYFHRTERCDSCLWAGQMARTTVERYFADELASGKVTFSELDIQKAENRALALKYRAGGSQLFLNYQYGGSDHILEARQTYAYVGNEARFTGLLREMIAKGLEGR